MVHAARRRRQSAPRDPNSAAALCNALPNTLIIVLAGVFALTVLIDDVGGLAKMSLFRVPQILSASVLYRRDVLVP